MINWLKSIFKSKDLRTFTTEKVFDIEHQIQYLRNEPRLAKMRPLGSNELMTPKTLIKFQQNRIKLLHKIANNNKSQNLEILNYHYNNMCDNCKTLFLTFRTSAVPCKKDYKEYSYCELTQQAIENGY